MHCKSGVWIWSAALAILLQQVLGSSLVVNGHGKKWDDVVSVLGHVDGEKFREIAYPLVEMSANAYRYPDVISIEGWRQVDAVAPTEGGMHAVLYEECHQTSRMVLAFRGTSLSGDLDSLADLCADVLLFGIDVSGVNCSIFSSATLDYYTQAVAYTQKVLRAYPEASLLLTGHSLGAGLAVLSSASVHSTVLPVIAFSAGPTKKALDQRRIHLLADDEHKIYVIADQWDEVLRTSWEGQVGILCLYSTIRSANCTACFEDHDCSNVSHGQYGNSLPASSVFQTHVRTLEKVEPQFSLSLACSSCFFETHYLQHVIDLVQLGNQPICNQVLSR